MNQDSYQVFGDLKADAQGRIEQAIIILEGASNLLFQVSRVYPDDRFLEERINGIVQGEDEEKETGILGIMGELREIKSTIASLEHIGVT